MPLIPTKRIAASGLSLVLLATVVAAFWYQDWRYSLPTPRPAGLRQPPIGALLDLRTVLGAAASPGRPVVIHVVDPECPCSRFNRDHLRALARRFQDRVAFVALVQGSSDPELLVRTFDEWGLGITVVPDPGGRRAALLGAYSTPQAVVVRADGRLYFRGNYNKWRYCVDERTEFARLAIERLLTGAEPTAPPREATVSWGCPLTRASAVCIGCEPVG